MGKINREKLFFTISAVLMLSGVVAGALYMAFSDSDSGLYSYLTGFLEGFDGKRFEIFKNSLADNFKLFLLITLCGFFKIGFCGNLFMSLTKGFISGFTVSAFVRYYGIRGIIIPLSSFLPNLIFIPAFLIFTAYSSSFSFKKNDKESAGRFLLLCLIFMTVFCVVSFLDGYVTTTFIKLFKPFVIKM